MIPIYRAEKIDSDEWVEGYLIPTNADCTTNDGFSIENSEDYHEIDPITLAIHFPNMIDKNGKKIFASLSEDGVGGDICESSLTMYIGVSSLNGVIKYDIGAIRINGGETPRFNALQVIGIYKGE